MPGRTDSRNRLLALLAIVFVASTGMVARLAYWQIGRSEQLTGYTTTQSAYTKSMPALRGTIWDRTGTIALAQTVYRYRIIGDPHDLSKDDARRTTVALIDYLSLSGDDAAAIAKAMDSDSYYVLLASGVEPDVVKEMRMQQDEGGLLGISFEQQAVRVYPQAGGAPGTSLAAHLLGFVNAAGKGQYGIEQRYDAILAGKPQVIAIDPTDPGPGGTVIVDEGAPGEDIRTTIDAGLQLQLEQEVFSAWIADRAKAVSGVVMDPKTGEILAEASYPSYDANEFVATANRNPDLFVDPIVARVYEPGSVFKMLTASAALKTKTTALTTYINDFGVLELAGDQEVADADRKPRGWMTFADMVAWSRNVGISQAAFRLGKTTAAASKALYDTWQDYGIGQKTGIDVAGEAAGIVTDPSERPWAEIDLANASFGQGVAVTPIQVLRAYAAMCNGGTLIQPRAVIPEGKEAQASAAAQGPRAVSSGISSSLVGLMEHVVTTVPSYAQRTYIPGYRVGGKTGTAQIWDPELNHGKGGWMVDIYNYSFYGWIGAEEPDLVIGVVVYEGTPTLIKQGVLDMPVQSYELFRRIATDAVVTQHIEPDPNAPGPPGQSKVTPQG
jgi:stage V sporulation protein D (sporulation-specific penicillin-binding protein)